MGGYPKEFIEYRRKIEYPCKCELCRRNFGKINIHHVNGDIKDNLSNNLFKCCNRCHFAIHHRRQGQKIGYYNYNSDENISFKSYCDMMRRLFLYQERIKRKDKLFEFPKKEVEIKSEDFIMKLEFTDDLML